MDDELNDMLASAVAGVGLDLVEVEVRSGLVRAVVDRDGGADVEAIAEATRAISSILDRHDPQPGRYTLEVSSPGVERPLRSPDQFARAVGETVTVRTASGGEGERRLKGVLDSADATGFVLVGEGLPEGGRRLSYEEIERARTVFEWPVASRPGGARRGGNSGRAELRAGHGSDTEKVKSR